ncbi:response regulator transcription factor [Raoultibacter phocaeensis]|uniref:response regulator transcription factor n=1 Tax=Raoultibacter phocaeensis TaxID=2479841 RepID=UPI0015D646E5|nr:helix-turn-helix transcriptional regulator [Raoultibacter phocaeensis]
MQDGAGAAHAGVARTASLGLGAWSFCFFGFAFARAWLEIVTYRTALLFPHDVWFGEDLFTVAMVVAFVPFALFARKLAPLYVKRCMVWLCTGSMIASGLAFMAASLFPGIVLPLSIVAIIGGGIGSALSILLWAELHSCFEPLRVVLYIAGAFLLGSFMAWVLMDLDIVRLTIVLMVLPLLSQVTLHASFSLVPRADLPKKTWGKLHFPWKLLVVLGIYQFVYGAKSEASVPSGELFLLGTIAVSIIVLAVSLLMSKRFDFTLLYRTPFVLMMCGLVMTFLSLSGTNLVAGFFIAAGYSLMFLVLTILLCDISHTYGVSVLVLCGIQEVTLIAIPTGHMVSRLFMGEQPIVAADPTLVTAVLTILVVIATVALISEKGHFSSWGVAFFGAGEIAEEDARAKLHARCADVSEAFGLSPREAEVLDLIAIGKNSAVIERELCIANGTLKSHTRRIYQKLGVHSREELRELLSADPQ